MASFEDKLTIDAYEDLVYMQAGTIYGGFDTDIFLQSIDEFTCSICHGVVRDPKIVVSCGHLFCTSCIESIELQRCPLDNNQLEEGTIQEEKFIKRLTLKKMVKCPLAKRQCEWEGELTALRDHLNECKFFMIRCPNHGCESVVNRENFAIHNEVCPNALIRCTWCDMKLKQANYDTHVTESCPLYPVNCPNGCDADEMDRKDLEQHVLKECKKAKVICQFREFGCYFGLENDEQESHYKTNIDQHLSLMKAKILQLEDEQVKFREDNVKLREENDKLQIITRNLDRTIGLKDKKLARFKEISCDQEERLRTIERAIFQKTRQDDVSDCELTNEISWWSTSNSNDENEPAMEGDYCLEPGWSYEQDNRAPDMEESWNYRNVRRDYTEQSEVLWDNSEPVLLSCRHINEARRPDQVSVISEADSPQREIWVHSDYTL